MYVSYYLCCYIVTRHCQILVDALAASKSSVDLKKELFGNYNSVGLNVVPLKSVSVTILDDSNAVTGLETDGFVMCQLD